MGCRRLQFCCALSAQRTPWLALQTLWRLSLHASAVCNPVCRSWCPACCCHEAIVLLGLVRAASVQLRVCTQLRNPIYIDFGGAVAGGLLSSGLGGPGQRRAAALTPLGAWTMHQTLSGSGSSGLAAMQPLLAATPVPTLSADHQRVHDSACSFHLVPPCPQVFCLRHQAVIL